MTSTTPDSPADAPHAAQLMAQGLRGFHGRLTTAFLRRRTREGRRVAVLTRPLAFGCQFSRKRIVVVAPPGFITDFASMPRAVRRVAPAIGRHAEAAVIHDWLYALGVPGDEAQRALADRVFLRAMERLGVPWGVRRAMHAAVRGGGAHAFGHPQEWRFHDPIDDTRHAPPFTRAEARRRYLCVRPRPWAA